MKSMLLIFSLATGISSVGLAAPGFYHNSKPVNSPAAGKALFDAIKAAKDSEEDVDVCYEGTYDDAIAATEGQAKGSITLNLIDVYGESEFPSLDMEFYNDKGDSTYGIVSSCN